MYLSGATKVYKLASRPNLKIDEQVANYFTILQLDIKYIENTEIYVQ